MLRAATPRCTTPCGHAAWARRFDPRRQDAIDPRTARWLRRQAGQTATLPFLVLWLPKDRRGSWRVGSSHDRFDLALKDAKSRQKLVGGPVRVVWFARPGDAYVFAWWDGTRWRLTESQRDWIFFNDAV